MFLIKSLKIHSPFGNRLKNFLFQEQIVVVSKFENYTKKIFNSKFYLWFLRIPNKKKKTKINYHLRFLIISIYLKNLIVCVPIIGPKVKVIRFCELLHSNEKNYINIHRCHQKNYNRFSISLKSQRERKIILN